MEVTLVPLIKIELAQPKTEAKPVVNNTQNTKKSIVSIAINLSISKLNAEK